jgi:hypothetical protein
MKKSFSLVSLASKQATITTTPSANAKPTTSQQRINQLVVDRHSSIMQHCELFVCDLMILFIVPKATRISPNFDFHRTIAATELYDYSAACHELNY